MPDIYEKVSQVLNAVAAVGKTEKNKEQGFNYRGIDGVVNAVNPELKKAGVFIVPEVLEHEVGKFENANKKIVTDVKVKVRYTWYAQDGSSVSSVVPGEARDFADKATAKAMSVAFRIHLLQMLALPTDDRDPDAESIEIDVPASTPTAPKTDETTALQGQIRDVIKAGAYTSEQVNAFGDKFSGGKKPPVWMKDAKVLRQILDAVAKGEVA